MHIDSIGKPNKPAVLVAVARATGSTKSRAKWVRSGSISAHDFRCHRFAAVSVLRCHRRWLFHRYITAIFLLSAITCVQIPKQCANSVMRIMWAAVACCVPAFRAGYIPQYREIAKTQNEEGFSTGVSFILLVANIMRVFFWCVAVDRDSHGKHCHERGDSANT